jgi:hypothetical protein
MPCARSGNQFVADKIDAIKVKLDAMKSFWTVVTLPPSKVGFRKKLVGIETVEVETVCLS